MGNIAQHPTDNKIVTEHRRRSRASRRLRHSIAMLAATVDMDDPPPFLDRGIQIKACLLRIELLVSYIRDWRTSVLARNTAKLAAGLSAIRSPNAEIDMPSTGQGEAPR
jgi:hypothetical protein